MRGCSSASESHGMKTVPFCPPVALLCGPVAPSPRRASTAAEFAMVVPKILTRPPLPPPPPLPMHCSPPPPRLYVAPAPPRALFY